MNDDKIIGMICVTLLAIGLVVSSYFITHIQETVVATVQMVISGIMGAAVGYNMKGKDGQ